MPTGNLLLFDPGQGTVHVLDAAGGAPREISRFGEPVTWTSAAFTSGGQAVTGASTGIGVAVPGMRKVDLEPGTISTMFELDPPISVYSARVSPDGTTLVFGAIGWVPFRSGLVQMDLATLHSSVIWLAPEGGSVQGLGDLRWLPDQTGLIGHLIQIESSQIVHFDLVTNTVTPITEPTTTLPMIRTLDLSPDGRTIAFNTPTGELRFITRSGESAPGFPTQLRGVLPAFSPDGKLLAWRRYRDGTTEADGVWFYRFSDGEMWRALPADSPLTWVLDWE